MRNDHSPRPSRGFGERLATSIVIVLILGVLAAIFMPALSRSREAARRAPDDSVANQSVWTLQSSDARQVQEWRNSASLSQQLQQSESVGRYLITDINNAAGARSARGSVGQALSVTPLPENRPVATEPLRYLGPT